MAGLTGIFFCFLRSGVHSLFDDTQRLGAELKSSNAEDQQRLEQLGSANGTVMDPPVGYVDLHVSN